MNYCKRIRQYLTPLFSVAMALGLMPIMEQASAASTTLKAIQIAAAQDNSIALRSDGTVIVWGDQADSWAKPPAGLTGVVEIYAKDTLFLARKSNGTIVAWGNNDAGELNIPAGLSNVISMAAAGHHTLMVLQSGVISGAGTAVGWGLNGNGQSTVPTDAQTAVTKVAAGTYYSMALKFNGTVVDWGSNGAGATDKPAGLSNVVAIDAGYRYALALKDNGTVVAWGQEFNGNGILDVAGFTDINAISANREHALALNSDGTVVGWGDNRYGRATPPAGLTDVVAIAAGVNHSLALKSDGTVVSWGKQTSVPGDNELNSLTISEAAPTPAFSSSVTAYQYDISPSATSVHINAVLKDTAYSALYINDQLQQSSSTVAIAVPAAGAVIKVRVEPYMKEPQTYTLTISRDREPPTATFSPNGSGVTRLRTISTAVSVTDTTSGIDGSTLEYAWSQRLLADGWASFSLLPYTQLAQFTHNGADGNWYLHIRGKDYAGNAVNATSAPFLLDNTAPVLGVTLKRADATAYLDDTWSGQDVVITATATDAASAIATFKYTLDGGKSWTDYTAPITITDSGIHTVIFQASDSIGNVQTESRTVKITKSDLTLTITMVNTADGSDYSSGEWTNSTVRVTAVAETRADETINSFTWNMNGNPIGVYTAGQQITFLFDGMNSGEFNVTDSMGGSMSVPYAVNIDRTAPTVSFTPNGETSPARTASVTARVADSGGSGLVESTLEYAWTQDSGTKPAVGWLPLNNDSTLTKEGVDGNWYLHVQGKDTAGNEVYSVSNRFALDNSALDSALSPDTASFDLKTSAQADVVTELTLNGNTLAGISNGANALVAGTDYLLTGNTVIIQKSYLAAQPEGTASLTFTFSGGANQTLTITINDTTPPSNSTISPNTNSFDKKASAQANVVTTLTLNGNTLAGISNGASPLAAGTDYVIAGNTVTILKTYLAAQPVGTTSLTFQFSGGANQALMIAVSDTTPQAATPTITIDYANEELIGFAVGGSYTLNGAVVSPASGKLAVEAYLGETLTIVKKGDGSTTTDSAAQNLVVPARPSTPTAIAVNPTTIGGTGTITGVTAAMEYKSSIGIWSEVTGTDIANLDAGTYQIRVKATASSFKSVEQTVTITELTPEVETTPAIAIDYANEELTGFAVGGSYTLNGAAVSPANGKLAVEVYLGETLAIVKKGDGSTTTDSTAQNLVVPARPSTPTAIAVNPTTIGGTGTITGVTAAMEYKSSTGIWSDVTGIEIANLDADTYQVRVKATASNFKSAVQTVTITELTPEVETTPTIAIDYANEELIGFDVGGSYTLNCAALSPASGKLAVEAYLGETLAIVKKGDGSTTTDSTAQNLVVPARPSTPTAIAVNPATIGGTGTITGVTAAMEYKSSTGIWSDVTGTDIANLDAGTYQIRVKATASSFKSAEQTVTINSAPIISGTPATSVNQEAFYSFIPTASDTDGDLLTFSITNKPTWASFNTATGTLTGTPAGTDTGMTTDIVISVSDGTISSALPAFNLEVISTVDPLQPIVTPPADLEINATGLFTPVTLRQLLSLNPNASQGDLDAAINAMAQDGVTGNDCCTTIAEMFTAASPVLLNTGRHEIKWRATNAAGVTGEATQVVNINPLVSLSKSQIAVRGSSVVFRMLLNGPAPVYPLSVPYLVDPSSTATGAEHNLVSGTATFTRAGQVEVSIPVDLAGVTGFSESQLVITLGTGINASAANRHVIDIRTGNVPPVVNLHIMQGGINTRLITPTGGPVTATATVTDANPGDTHSFDWSATTGMADTDGNPTDASRVFDPSGLTGSNQVLVTVVDSGGASVQASVYFRVVSSLPVLDANTDTDQDGINDDLEGAGDTDGNGIPDYLDNMPSTNILPQQGNTTSAYLIECDPGVRCGLGLFALSGNSGGVQVLDDELGTLDNLIIDPEFAPVGGIFDFVIRDLPAPGQSVRVVIPQRAAIPANAVYRKYQRGRWVSFITDDNNAVHSAPGFTGYCPPPGSTNWTPGLNEGHLCVQLTIQDGGANDDDGLVNSSIADPGAVSVARDIPAPEPEPEPEPEPQPQPEPEPPAQVKPQGGGGSMGGQWLVGLILLGGLLMLKRRKAVEIKGF